MRNRLILVSLSLIMAACGSFKTSDTVVQPVLDAEAVEQAVAEGIEVAFYGDECTVSAPAALPAGEYTFVLRDFEEKRTADLYVARLTDGHVFQDLLDPQGDEPGLYYPKPDWLIYATKIDVEWDQSSGDKSITYSLEEGEHAIYVSNVIPPASWGLWFCVPIMVVETTSE